MTWPPRVSPERFYERWGYSRGPLRANHFRYFAEQQTWMVCEDPHPLRERVYLMWLERNGYVRIPLVAAEEFAEIHESLMDQVMEQFAGFGITISDA